MKRYWLQIKRDSLGRSHISAAGTEYHPELLERLAALGIIELEDGMLEIRQLTRLEKVFRLRSCLGVNLSGAAIILDLLEKIEELKAEIRRLENS